MFIPVEKVKELLISNLGTPDNQDKFDEYIEFIYENEYHGDEFYCEDHHILPRCIKENDHTVRLKYNDHCEAHMLLFLAYNRNDLQCTLNFMKPTLEERKSEYRDAISKARRRGWNKFKNSEQYDEYVKRMAEITSGRMKDGWASELSKKRYSKSGAREKISTQFKELWADDEYKERVRQSMIEERNSPAGKARMKKAAQKMWDNKSIEEKEQFVESTTRANQNINKREDASRKIKKKWKDPEFKSKMLKRPKRSEEKNKEHSNILKEKWKDPAFKAMMLKKRKEARERKLKNETK